MNSRRSIPPCWFRSTTADTAAAVQWGMLTAWSLPFFGGIRRYEKGNR